MKLNLHFYVIIPNPFEPAKYVCPPREIHQDREGSVCLPFPESKSQAGVHPPKCAPDRPPGRRRFGPLPRPQDVPSSLLWHLSRVAAGALAPCSWPGLFTAAPGCNTAPLARQWPGGQRGLQGMASGTRPIAEAGGGQGQRRGRAHWGGFLPLPRESGHTESVSETGRDGPSPPRSPKGPQSPVSTLEVSKNATMLAQKCLSWKGG